MKLVLKEVYASGQHKARQYHTAEPGSLVAAAAQVFWPVDVTDVTAVNAKSDEPVAFARWHDYLCGYQSFIDLEVVGAKDRNDAATFPTDFSKDPFLAFYDSCMDGRKDWQGTSHYWVLINVMTREPFRKQGATSMLLEWGLTQARKVGAPAFLEAAPEVKGLYEKLRFESLAHNRFILP